MSIAGNIKTMQLAELLQWLSQSNKTGTLVIDNGTVKKQIFFQDGRIISSASSDPKEYLGHFLVSHGFINETELSKAVEMQERTGMLLGKILVTIGAISEDDLHRLLRLKAEEGIYHVFTWPEGEFRFLDGQLPERTMIPLSLDVTGLVLEGARRTDEWKRIREHIPHADAIPVSMVEPLDDGSLSAGERKVLEQVNDDRTVEEICLQTHASEFYVCRVLFDQIRAKRLKVVKPRKGRSEDGPPGSGGAVNAGTLIREAARHLQRNAYEQTLRHLRAARSLEPENRQIQTTAEQGEKRLREALHKEGVTLDSVPTLAAEMADLTASKISPQEGFMLTRINGTYDIRSILKISPMPELEALLVFWRLNREGHIHLSAKK